MPGKMIDRAALTLAGTAGLYLLFLNAGFGVPVSCGLTFVCAALLHHLVRHRPRSRRVSLARAEATLQSISLMEQEEAEDALRTLTGREDAPILLRHPEGTLTLDELYGLWRAQGDGATLIVTCGMGEDAARFAKSRRMEIIDKRRLVKRIRETGLYVTEKPPAAPPLQRLERIWRGVRARPRMAFYGLGLISMYLATGQALCLICALGTLGIMGAKLIERYT